MDFSQFMAISMQTFPKKTDVSRPFLDFRPWGASQDFQKNRVSLYDSTNQWKR